MTILESTAFIGGTTCLSGGVTWVPANHLMAGGADSAEAGLAAVRFAEFWAGPHAEFRFPGARGYAQHHEVPGSPRPGLECVADLNFADLEALRTTFASNVYRDLVSPDEVWLVEPSRMRGMRATVARDKAGDPSLAAVVLHREPPRATPPLTRRMVAAESDRSGFHEFDVIALGGPAEAGPGALLSRPPQVL